MDPSLATIAPSDAVPRTRRLPAWVAIALVIAIGMNIRAIFGVTPPLVPVISADLGLSGTTASLLTAMPVLAMGLCAPLGHALTQRIGADAAMIALLVVLGVTELSRLLISTAVPLVLTAGLIGGALGAISTLTPGFISHHLPRLRGLATGLYSTSMALGVALAAGTARPVTEALGGWRVALASWGAAALLLATALVLVRSRGVRIPRAAAGAEPGTLPLRERRAWFVTAVYAAPMFLGFGVIAWLPSLFIEVGLSPGVAAAYLVLFQLVQLLSMLTLTPLTDRIRGRRAVFAAAMGTSTAGLLLLTVAPLACAVPGLLLAGFGIGGASSLALVKVQDEAVSPLDATRLSSMAMLFSFTAGAMSPFLMGALKDLSGSLVPGFGLCLAVSILSLGLLVRMHPATPRGVGLEHPTSDRTDQAGPRAETGTPRAEAGSTGHNEKET